MGRHAKLIRSLLEKIKLLGVRQNKIAKRPVLASLYERNGFVQSGFVQFACWNEAVKDKRWADRPLPLRGFPLTSKIVWRLLVWE